MTLAISMWVTVSDSSGMTGKILVGDLSYSAPSPNFVQGKAAIWFDRMATIRQEALDIPNWRGSMTRQSPRYTLHCGLRRGSVFRRTKAIRPDAPMRFLVPFRPGEVP